MSTSLWARVDEAVENGHFDSRTEFFEQASEQLLSEIEDDE